jgi:hypothetical protein
MFNKFSHRRRVNNERYRMLQRRTVQHTGGVFGKCRKCIRICNLFSVSRINRCDVRRPEQYGRYNEWPSGGHD